MDRRFTITIRGDAAERLSAVAVAERRDPREQAALIVERFLASVGRLSTCAGRERALLCDDASDVRPGHPPWDRAR